MRGKRLAVKVLVWFALVAALVGVVFCLGYRARHPVPENPDTQHNEQQSNGIVPVNLNNATPDNGQRNDNESYAQKWLEPIVLLTFLLVLGVGITAYIYWRQLKKMEETVALVGKQGKTMQDQLAAMEWQAGILEIQTGLVDKQVEKMQGQWDAMEHQATISQAMIDNAKESFYLSERAYIGLKTFAIEPLPVPPPPPMTEQKFMLRMTFINGGRTPAWNVSVQMALNIGKEPNLDQDWTKGEPNDSEAFLPAGEVFRSSAIQPDAIPSKALAGVDSEIVKLFVVGECRYKDILNPDRVYPFCLAYKPRQRIFKHYKASKDHREPN